MIELHNVTVAYGDHKVLDSVTLSVNSNEILYVLGPSGAGKTTLFRLITGLEVPTEGTVSKNGTTLSVAFQEPRLFPSLTVRDNILAVTNGRTNAADPDTLLRLLGLYEAKDLYPEELSGGMQKRASLARGLAVPADLYIFDEPTSGQDKTNTERIAQAILRYTKGKTVLIATHDEHLRHILPAKEIRIENGKCQ